MKIAMNVSIGSRKNEKVFRVVGEFLRLDRGPSCLMAVDAFRLDDLGAIGAVASWDVHPTGGQMALFRRIWDERTNLTEVTILHDAPSSVVDQPRLGGGR